jgi:hypothetical protein
VGTATNYAAAAPTSPARRTPVRPRNRNIKSLILRIARQNPTRRGYLRIRGASVELGGRAVASAVWEILKNAGVDG